MDDIRQALDKLRASPSDEEAWSLVSIVVNANTKDHFITFLKENPPVLQKFKSMVKSDPEIISTFFLNLEDMDALEASTSRVTDPSYGSRDKTADTLESIDKELADILGDQESARSKSIEKKEDAMKLIEDDLEDIKIDEKKGQESINQYNELIKQAKDLSYSFSEADIDKSITLYEQALSLKDDQAIDWYNLGQAYLKRAQKKVGVFTYGFEGSYKDPTDFYNALDTSKKAVLLDPTDRVYWENLATIYEIVNKKPLAVFCLKHSLTMLQEQEQRFKDSGLVGSTSLQADMITFLQKKIDQLKHDEPSEIDPFDDAAVFEYEKRYRREKLSKHQPLNHVELIAEAYEQQEHGNLDGTIAMLKKAVEIKPDFFEAWMMLADLSNQLAMATTDLEQRSFSFSDALRYTNEALKINASSIEPYKVLAQQYNFLGARDDYIRTLTKITELEPENWEYKKKLADVYCEKGVNFHIYNDAIQARSFFARAIEIYPYDHVAWKWAGKNHVLLGQLPEAINAYNESLRLEETDASTKEGLVEALFLQAEKYHADGLLDKSLENIGKIEVFVSGHAKAMALFDSIVEGLCDTGFDALEDSDDENAIKIFEKVLQIQPGYPFALFGLAKVHFKNGNHDASLDNALLALEEWCSEIMRYADEFIRHKALDALGDLKLSGYEIQGKLRFHRAGHDLHARLVAEIFK
nr:UDP-3-O-acyl-N-acetylglucosamine deacetylase [Candidatus Sigynarchaeota archaeon]